MKSSITKEKESSSLSAIILYAFVGGPGENDDDDVKYEPSNDDDKSNYDQDNDDSSYERDDDFSPTEPAVDPDKE